MKPHEYTAGTTDEMLGPRFDVVPYDADMPDIGECVYCGYRSSYPDLIRTVLKDQPGVIVRRCLDSQACIRRRRRAA